MQLTSRPTESGLRRCVAPLSLLSLLLGLLVLSPSVGAQAQPQIRVSPSPLVFTEGQDTSVTISLSEQPTDDVDVTINPQDLFICVSRDCFDVLTNRTQVTIPADQWETGVTYRFGAENIETDSDTEDNTGSIRFTAQRHQELTLSYTMLDDNRPYPEFEFSSSASFEIAEGGTSRLVGIGPGRTPGAPVRIYAISSDPGAVTVSPVSRYFASRSIASFTVTAVEDGDIRDENVTITFELRQSSGEALPGGNTATEAAVTVTDDESIGFHLPGEPLKVNEGGGGRFNVRLSQEPSAPVRVQISTRRGSDISLNRTDLTFTIANYSNEQTVPFTVRQDSDSDSELDVIELSAVGGGYEGITGEVRVQIQDDEVPQVTGMPTAARVAENGTLTVDTLRLSVRPSADVTVRLASSDTDRLSLSPETLTFTRSNWNIGKEVTLSGVEDGDLLDDETLVNVTASGAPGFEGVMGSFRVDVTDISTRTVSAVATDLTSLDEGGAAGSIAVRLNSRPSGAVEVRAGVPGYVGSAFAACAPGLVCRPTMTFNPSNWNTVQSFRILPNEDQDDRDFDANLMITASGADYTGAPAVPIRISITDNDRPGLRFSNSKISIDEGAGGSFTVRLNSRPLTQVSVKTTAGRSLTSVNPAQLVFSPDNWNSPQTVYVAARSDPDGYNENTSVTFTADGNRTSGGSDNPYESVTGSVDIEIVDDEEAKPGFGISLPSGRTWVEGDQLGVNVRLLSIPDTETVTVTLAIHPADASKIRGATSKSATRSRDQWSEDLLLSLNLAQDTDITDDEVTLTVTTSGGNYDGFTETFTGTIYDDDTNRLAVTPSDIRGEMDEGGDGVDYWVRLGVAPTAAVTVDAASSDSGAATVSPSSLTFTTALWDVPQKVTAAPVDDADSIIERGSITFSASDGGYGGQVVAMPFTVFDDETGEPPAVTPPAPSAPAIELSIVDNEPFREGGQGTLRITLLTEPSRDTAFDVTTTSNKVSKTNNVVTTATIERADWLAGTRYVDAVIDIPNEEQTGDEYDDYDLIDHTITLTVTGSQQGSNYNNVAKNISVTIYDNDERGDDENRITERRIIITPANGSGDIIEGGAPLEYGVRLIGDNFDEKDVTVKLTSSDTSAATVSPSELVFVPTSDTAWRDEVQTFTVAPVSDRDAEDDSGTITLATESTNSDFDDLKDANDKRFTASFTVKDDDGPAELDFTVGLDRSSQGVVENNTLSGAAAIFRIKLSDRPSGTVSGTVTSTDTARLGNRTFNVQPSNWDGHNFDLAVPADSDTVNNDVDFTVTLDGGGFDNYSKTFTVTIFDKDSDNLAVTPVTDSVLYEGGSSREFYVRMSKFSSGVSVNLTSSDTGAVTVSPSSLTLGSLQPAKFTVTSVADDDARDERVFINIGGSGGSYNNVTARVPVTVLDSTTYQPVDEVEDEQLSFNLSAEELLRPDRSGAVRINTTGRPTGPVTFTFFSQELASLRLTDADGQSISSLTFQPGDYSADPNGGKTFGITVSEPRFAGPQQFAIEVTANGGGFDNVKKGFEVRGFFPADTSGHRFRFIGGPQLLAESGGGAQYKVIPIAYGSSSPVDITVDITAHSGATDAVTIHPTQLSFKAAEWDTPKAFTVTPVIDSDGSDERVTIKARMNGYNPDTRSPFTDNANFTNTYLITIKDDHTTDPTFTMTSDVMREIVTDSSDPDTIAGNIYVRLSDRPSGTVTFTPTFSTGSSLSASATTFTVAPNDWSRETKFALHHGALDGNDTNDEVTITLTADGGGYDDLAKSFKLTVFDSTDYAIAAAPLDRYAVAVEEGRPVQYAVRLTRAPATGQTVDVSVTSSNASVVVDTDPDTAGNQGTLSFAEAGDAWSEIQTVNVRALHDDNRNNEDVSITFSTSDGAYAGSDDVVLPLTVIDNEVIPSTLPDAGLSDINDISGSEGARIARSVELDVAPRGDVQVNLVSDNPDITFSSDAAGSSAITSLSFDGGNWDTGQTFYTVLGQDMDPVDDSATVSLLGSGGGYDGVAESYSVTVDDSGTLPSTFMEFVQFTTGETFTLEEGRKQRIGVRLRFSPISGVQFSNERSSSGDVGDYVFETEYSDSGAASALLFTRDNWNAYQYFSITPFIDLNSTDDTGALNLRLEDIPVAGAGQGSGGGDIISRATGASLLEIGSDGSMTVTDTLSASIVLTEDALSVVEGEEAVYSVRLGAWDEVRGTDTKQVSVSGASGDPSAVLSSPDSLTFTSSNWNVPQELTFATVEDADTDSEAVALTFSVSGGGYSSVSTQATLNIRDNDSASLVLSESAKALSEGGLQEGLTVKLSSQPSDNVSIRFGSSDSTAVGVDADPATTGTQGGMIFTTSNWDTPRPFSILAFDDADSVNEDASVTLSATGGGYDGVTASIGVTVTDDEEPGLTFSPERLSMNEGDVANMDVRLRAIPSSDVTVTLTLPSGVEDSLSTDLSTLIFTPERWNIGQSFTLTALRDADFGDERIKLTLTNSGGGFDGTGGEVEVLIYDDNPNLVLSLADRETLQVPEGGSKRFTVRLDRDPGADGSEFYFEQDGGRDSIRFDTDLQMPGDQYELNFTSASWETPQTVEVYSLEDLNAVNETATLSLKSDNDLDAVEIAVEVQDANIAQMSGIPVATTVVDEGGSTTISNLRLLSAPLVEAVLNFEPSSGAVNVDTDPGQPGDQRTMRFTPEDWQTPRSIVLTANQDPDGIDDELTIDITATGDAFQILMGSFDVQTDDDDPRGVSAVEASSGSAAALEEGGSGVKIYEVTLDTKPSGPVTVRPHVTHPDSVHYCRTTSPTLSQCVDSLVFTPDNYDTSQQFVIGAGEDINGADETVTLTYTASGADYQGATIASTSTDLTITDNDVPGLTTVPEWGVYVEEGEVVEFTVVLDTQPTAEMRVDFQSSAATAGSSTIGNPLPAELTFTPSNWNIPQVMRVFTGTNDSSTDDTTIPFTLEPFGGGYGHPQDKTMTLIIADTSTPSRTLKEPITKSVNPYVFEAVSSGAAGKVSAKLSEIPTGAVTLTFAPKTSADSDKVEISNATIELNPLNWDDAASSRAATVTVKSGGISDHDTATLTVTANGGGYDDVTADLEVPLTHTSSPDLVVHWPDPDKVYWERVSGDWVPYLEEGGSGHLTIGIGPSEAISGAGVTLTATITQNTGAADISFNNSTAANSATATWDEDDGTDEILEFKVTPETDSDTVDTPVQIQFSAQGAGSNFATAVTKTVTINVKEVNVVSSPDTLRLDLGNKKRISGLEGLEVGSACSRCTLTVKLSQAPTAQVSVTFSSDNPDISVVGADGTTVIDSLVFTTSNWNVGQDYWVRVADDDEDAEDEQTTLTLTASGGGYSGISEGQIVEIFDNDDPSVSFFPGSPGAPVTVDEGVGARTFTMSLDHRPAAPVSFTLDSSAGPEAGRFRISPETISFTRDNWNQPQPVSLSHLGDDNAFNSTEVSVPLKATGGGVYATENSGIWSFSASTLNDPEQTRIVTSPSVVSVYEGGSVDVLYSLSHLCYPASDQANSDYWIRVSDSKQGDDDSANPAIEVEQLRSASQTASAVPFDSLNWNQSQVVRITALQDSDSDSEQITVNLTGAQQTETLGCAGRRGGLTGEITVLVVDDDAGALPRLSKAELNLMEGGAPGRVTLALSEQPDGPVRAVLSSRSEKIEVDSNVGITGRQEEIIFTTSNWSTPVTISVRPLHDEDIESESIDLTVTATGGGVNSSAFVRVNIEDDDEPGIILSATELSIEEDSADVFDVRLNASPAPGTTTSVSLTQPGIPSVTVDTNPNLAANQTRLTFTAGNWNVPQAVSVNVADDLNAFEETGSIGLSATGGGFEDSASVKVVVQNNDTRDFVIRSETIEISEGGSTGVMVTLASKPSGDVAFTIESSLDGLTTSSTGSGTFTPADWNTPQSVTLSLAQDDNGFDEGATIIFRVSGSAAEYTGELTEFSVNVSDDETAAVLTEVTGGAAVQEGGSATFGVKLAAQPGGPGSGDVTVTPSCGNCDQLSFFPASLTFTQSNWDTWADFTFNALDDDDAVSENVEVEFAAAGRDYNGLSAVLPFAVIDDESPGVVFSETLITLSEASSDAVSTMVKLSQQPSGAVELTFDMSGIFAVTLDTDANTATDQHTLTFTTADWETEQEVLLKPVADFDANNESGSIPMTFSGGGYEALNTSSVNVTLDFQVEDDEVPSLICTPKACGEPYTQAENAADADIVVRGVRLGSLPEPGTSVTVILRSSNPDVTFTNEGGTPLRSLIFSDQNWSVDQRFKTVVAEDSDAANETAVITLRAGSDRASGIYNNVSESYTLNITDDENSQIGITLSAGDADSNRLTVREGGSAQFDVKPDVPPTRPMTISLSAADIAKGYALAPASLSFNSANYQQDKTFQISPPSDRDLLDEDVSVTLEMSGGEFAGATQTLYLTIEDDETPELLITPGSLTVSEGLTQTFTVQLLAEPSIRPTSQGNSGSSSGYDVDVEITSGNSDAVRVLTPSLSFSASEWNVPKEVSLRGAEDDNQLAESPTITLTTSATACSGCPSPDYDGVSKTISVRTIDNDIPNIHLSDLLLDFEETGVGGRFTVNLLNQPNADVTVSVTSSDAGAVTVSPGQLTFTDQNWNQPHTVIVTPVHDADSEDERITITASGSGGGYLNTSGTLTVVVRDEDPAQLQLTKNRLVLSEGNTATFAVSLASAPVSRINVTLTSRDLGAVTVSPDILDFDPDDWNTRTRIVTVMGEPDSDAQDEMVTVDLEANGGGYTGVSAQVGVEIVDDGEAELILPARVQIVEGSEASFDVRLGSEPESPVTLTLAQPDNPDVTIDTDEFTPGDQTTMTFNSVNWSVSRPVKMIARDDGDTRDEPTSIAVVASGADYEGLTATIDVSLIDDDRIRLLLVPGKELTVTEGSRSGGALSVRLGSLPSGTVMVTPSVSEEDKKKVTLSPSTMTFNATNWQTTQDITVIPQNDPDPVDERVLLNLATEGGGYDGRNETVLVEITDNDVAELMIENDPEPITDDPDRTCPSSSYCMYEDDADGKAIRLKLSAQPSENVTIAVTSSNSEAVQAATQTLTFTPDDWNQTKSATLLPVLDPNAFEEDVVITLSAADGGYDGVTATVDVEAWETSTPGMDLPAKKVRVPEGGSKAFSVRLSAQPLYPALVILAQPPNPDLQIDTDLEEDGLQNSLQFSPGDWNVPQEVTVFAGRDEDAKTEQEDIELKLLGSDYPEDGITASVTVEIVEAQKLGIVVTGAPLTVHEGGATGETGELQVSLRAKPTVEVTVTVDNDHDAIMSVLPASLTFSPSDWNQPQILTVTGLEDDNTNDHPDLSFDLEASGGEYAGTKLEDITVSVIDNDQIDDADLVVSTNMLNILEGESEEFTVKLAVVPEGRVTVRVISQDPLAASVSPSRLTFTRDNWDVDQTVTVTGVQDLFDLDDAETKVIFSATGGGYSGVGAGWDISVMITDAEGSEADVVKQVLAESGRSALIGTQEVIGRRLDAAPGLRTATVAGREISLSRQASRDLASGFAAAAGGQKLGGDRFDGFRFGHERHSMHWLGGVELKDGKPLQKAPELSTLGRSIPLLGNFTYDLSADRGVGWTLWGRLDQREFSGEMDASLPGETQKQTYESSQSSVWLGFDRRLVSGAVIGIAVSQSSGEGSYKVYKSMLEMETNVTNYLSYFELGLGSEGRLRIMLGSGSGDMTVTPLSGPASTVNLTTVLGSLGFRWPLARVGQGRLVLTGSLGLSEVSTDEAVSQCSLNSCTRIDPQGLNHGAAISEIDAANNSARVGLQLEPRPWTLGTDWKLEPRIGMSLRQDSGDGIEGSGAELTSAIKLNTPSERFSIDLGMQYLGTHSAAELSEEWGASLEFALHSIDDSGRGLSLSLGPQWGLRDTGLLERAEAFSVNDSAARRRSGAARQQAASLGARLGYGLDALGGMLTPFAEFNFTGGTRASSRQNLGVRFNTTDELEARLFSEQRNVRGGANTSGFGFEIRKTY